MPRYDLVFAVLERLERELREAPDGLPYLELVRRVRGVDLADDRQARNNLRNLWLGDPRFREEADCLRPARAEEMAAQRDNPSFVVLDLETTGIGTAENRIIEIGALRLDPTGEGEEFHSLVDPQKPLTERIIRLTGITPEMLSGAPACPELLPRFLAFCGPLPLVAHNAPFDAAFLHSEAERAGMTGLPGDWLCTARLARLLLPAGTDFHLDDLTARFGLRIEERHRSLGDVRGTAGVFLALRELWRQQPERVIPLTPETEN